MKKICLNKKSIRITLNLLYKRKNNQKKKKKREREKIAMNSEIISYLSHAIINGG